MATVCEGRSASCSSRGEAKGSRLRFDFGSAGNGYRCNAQWSLEGERAGARDVKAVSTVSTLRILGVFA
jgi:hypothetical protein